MSPRARARRELRHRVDALHRQRVKLAPGEFALAVEKQSHLHDELRDAPPLTLAFDVAEELRRRGWGRIVKSKMSGRMRIETMNLAKWAATVDDSTIACAVFAVDMALHWATRSLRFDTPPYECFVQAEARRSYFDALRNMWLWPLGTAGKPDDLFGIDSPTGAQANNSKSGTVDRHADDLPEEKDTQNPVPLAGKDLAQIRRINPDLAAVRETGTLSATWSPHYKDTIYSCDVMRPPVEALVFVKRAVGAVSPITRTISLAKSPAALCIGTGWGGAAQALSALLPMHWVYHQPWPYHEVGLPSLDWDVVVLNIPARHHWMAARVIGSPDEVPWHVYQKVMGGSGSGSGGEHVELLVNEALKHVGPKTLIVLMADYRTYQQALGHLRVNRVVTPVTFNGIDTGQQPVWCAYRQQPWAPHGLPRPTARMVSFWKVTP